MTAFIVEIQILISQNIFHIINLYEIREVFSVSTPLKDFLLSIYIILKFLKKQYNIKETLIECFFKKNYIKKKLFRLIKIV